MPRKNGQRRRSDEIHSRALDRYPSGGRHRGGDHDAHRSAAQNRDRIVIGMQLEPPHLDPTAGAAAAIDEVTYSNLFESLTGSMRAGR